jgi:hypothetical protein
MLEYVFQGQCDVLNPNVPQKGSGHFGEGALDQIEPGAMLGCMDVFKAPRASPEVSHGLFGDVH